MSHELATLVTATDARADLYRLIDFQIHNFDKINGQTLNVGGGTKVSTSLCELTALCRKITGNEISITQIAETRQWIELPA